MFDPWEDSLDKEMATRSSILVWRIPWPEEQGGTGRTWVSLMGFELGERGTDDRGSPSQAKTWDSGCVCAEVVR